MKLKHYVALAFLAIGVLYVLHIAMNHGGVSGFKSGLGVRG